MLNLGRPHRNLNDAGAVDEHVDRPDLGLDRRGAGFGRLFVADVGAPSAAADLLGYFLGAAEIAIENNDFRAIGGELAATSGADAARAAGDNGDSLDPHGLPSR